LNLPATAEAFAASRLDIVRVSNELRHAEKGYEGVDKLKDEDKG
jgi:hypothetical protein